MKQKLFLVILTIMIVTTILVGCNNSSETVSKNSSNNNYKQKSELRIVDEDEIVLPDKQNKTVDSSNDIAENQDFEQEEQNTVISKPVVDEFVIDYVKYTDAGDFYYATKENDGISGDIVIFGEVKSKPVRIKSFGFENTNITSVTIKNGVEEVEELAFSGCNNLNEFIVEQSNEFFATKDGVLYSKDLNTIVQYPTGRSYDVITIEDNINNIRSGAFDVISVGQIRVSAGNRSYATHDDVLFNADRTELHFYPSDKTGTIYSIPTTVIKIISKAFSNCANLVNLVLPNNLSEIGAGAFNNCTSLTTISIPTGVTEIKTATFLNCRALNEITIPSNITKIEKAAFEGCESLTSMTIPQTVQSVGLFALYRCDNITSVTVPFVGNSNQNNNENNYFGYIFGALSVAENKTKVPTNLKTVNITNQTANIIDNAFADCKSIETINLGATASVTSIGQKAFYNCNKLTAIDIPDNVTLIKNDAFNGCYDLTTIDLGNNIQTIQADAFGGCRSMTTVNVPSLDKFLDISFANKYSNPIWQSGEIKINGQEITEINIENCTQIKPYAFYNSKKLTRITLPQNLEGIGEYAFFNCYNLTNIVIPDSVNQIGAGAFSGTKIQSITIPSEVEKIDKETFSNCQQLASITFAGERCEHIEDKAFYNCPRLTEFVVPSSVKSIGNYAFFGDYRLSKITIGSGVESNSIGLEAFGQCMGLIEVTIDSSNVFSDQTKASANGGLCYFAKSIFVKSTITATPSVFFNDITRFDFSETCEKQGYKKYKAI